MCCIWLLFTLIFLSFYYFFIVTFLSFFLFRFDTQNYCVPYFLHQLSLNLHFPNIILIFLYSLQFYWLNLNVGYDGDVYVTIVLNGVIHTVMYTYYFVSLHTKEIWWKSALTMCQMVQFVVMNAQAMYLLSTECTEFPRNITLAYGYYIVTLLLLFAHFFFTSYIVGGKKKKSHSRDNKIE